MEKKTKAPKTKKEEKEKNELGEPACPPPTDPCPSPDDK